MSEINHIKTGSTEHQQGGLGTVVVSLLHLVRDLRDQIAGLREALQVALDLIADTSRQLDRARVHNVALRAELRAYFSGKTIAEGRQAETEHDKQAAA